MAMLMTIPGISEEKALAIVRKYPTLKSLIDSYVACELSKRETMLSNIEVHYN